jgi:hypothetical protein
MGGGIGAGMMGIPGRVDRPVASALRKFEHLGQSVSSIRARGCSAELPFLDFAAPRLKRATCADPTVEWISRQITEAFPLGQRTLLPKSGPRHCVWPELRAAFAMIREQGC